MLEGWFARNEEAINAYIYETSRKQINIPKVLDFNWLKSEKLKETRAVLKHQKLKKLLELTGIKMKITSEVWNSVAGIKYAGLKVGKGNTSGIS